MRLLIVGSDKSYAIENFYVKHIRAAGIDVHHFAAQSIFYDYYQGSVINKLLFRAGVSRVLSSINTEFKDWVKNLNPTVVWIFKGMEIFPETLQWVKSRKVKLVNYNPDNPFIFTGKGSGNKNVTESIPLYDLHFTYNLEIEEALKKKYNANTVILPFGFDISDDLYYKCLQQEELLKVCFLGNPDRQRAFFLQALAENGVSMDVYGNNWSRFVSHSNINVFQPVYGEDLWQILRKYRIQLNLLRIHNEQSHNMRTFEVPGIGGILLAPNTPEHRAFFDDGQEAFFYNDLKHCITLTSEILSYSTQVAETIRMNARAKSLKQGYSYQARALQALDAINRLQQ